VNFLHNPIHPQQEHELVELLFKYKVRRIDAAAFMQVTPALVRYRLHGVQRAADGKIQIPNQLMAKVSRPEVAEAFLSPPPERIVQKLLAAGQITALEAQLAPQIPMADDLCVESDSGGHTDMGIMSALLPTILRQRDSVLAVQGYQQPIHVGAAGGIGTPEAAASAFILGADFILTGSINQCTPQAGTSDAVKDLLQTVNVQDTDYAPAGDMFELGAKVQVMRKGVFFPARANKLYELYRQHNSLDEIDAKTRQQIQEKYFKRSFDEVYAETKAYYLRTQPQVIDKAEQNPKHKMALIFKWYFIHSSRLALQGDPSQRVDYQVHCGPALGAFNQWVKNTPLEAWQQRDVDLIAEKLMQDTAALLANRLQAWGSNS
jgi:trans-AT polyketide synthase/acyltransferase/oxidoreductase domain-containing protein